MQAANERATARLAWARTATGDPALALEPASSDASFRSYWRGASQGRSLIVMDSPPAQEDPRPWVEIGARLAAAGLHVPAIYAQDLEQGFLLIEDLGSRLYLSALDAHSADRLYGEAMDALLRMQAHADVRGLPPYDYAFLSRELEIMPEWFLGRHLGRLPDAGEWDVLEAAFRVLLDNALEQPQGFVHRDYHSRNLLVLERGGPGIIDFQGALVGPLTYDLASLLRDAYVAWDEERIDGWVESYRLRLKATHLIGTEVDHARFMRWFDLAGLQRHIKVLGLFCRLYYRDGKLGYLADLPRVYDYVVRVASRHHELGAFVELLKRRVAGRDLGRPDLA
ncbi:aminoglycoside phosphotransferase family protein [Frateuria defendens]|uniref:aminoglycoside phosphotransferase family protein n=1 Tax=Frateuria defendens TaxID=2219559 RepID=UPI00066FC4BA|nr:phosphotransferase [Frateuria defendens]